MSKEITLAIVDTYRGKKFPKLAIDRTIEKLKCKKILFFSDSPLNQGESFFKINQIKSLSDYSEFILHCIPHFIDTDKLLIIQWDGFAVRQDLWTDDFLLWDYIGAPWLNLDPKNNVGNGGFSIRTTKLMEAAKTIPIHTTPYLSDGHAEDALISRHHRSKLEEYGIRFAPVELAITFSSENPSVIGKSFGFHGAYNFPFYLSENILIELHDELLDRINKSTAICLFLYNASKINYLDLIKTCQHYLNNNHPKKLTEIIKIFNDNNLNILQ